MAADEDVKVITARRAVFNVFAIFGTFFASLSVVLYLAKGGSLPFAISVGYAFGAGMALFYYFGHRDKFPAIRVNA